MDLELGIILDMFFRQPTPRTNGKLGTLASVPSQRL